MRRSGWWMVALAALVLGYAWGRRRAAALPYGDLALRAGTQLLQERRRVLALGAWPGELERLAGGTLWRLKQSGAALAAAEALSGSGRLAFYATPSPNTRVDISLAREQKWAAVRAYPSALPAPDAAHRWLLQAQATAPAAGLPSSGVEALYGL